MYFRHIQGRIRHGRRQPRGPKKGHASLGSVAACRAGKGSSSRCSISRSRKSIHTVLTTQQGSGQKRHVLRPKPSIKGAKRSISWRIPSAIAAALPRTGRWIVSRRFNAQLDSLHCRVEEVKPVSGRKRSKSAWSSLFSMMLHACKPVGDAPVDVFGRSLHYSSVPSPALQP